MSTKREHRVGGKVRRMYFSSNAINKLMVYGEGSTKMFQENGKKKKGGQLMQTPCNDHEERAGRDTQHLLGPALYFLQTIKYHKRGQKSGIGWSYTWIISSAKRLKIGDTSSS